MEKSPKLCCFCHQAVLPYVCCKGKKESSYLLFSLCSHRSSTSSSPTTKMDLKIIINSNNRSNVLLWQQQLDTLGRIAVIFVSWECFEDELYKNVQSVLRKDKARRTVDMGLKLNICSIIFSFF